MLHSVHDSVTETALKLWSPNELHATYTNFDLETSRVGVCEFGWKRLKVTVAWLESGCVWVVHCDCPSGCTIELRTDSALKTLTLTLYYISNVRAWSALKQFQKVLIIF